MIIKIEGNQQDIIFSIIHQNAFQFSFIYRHSMFSLILTLRINLIIFCMFRDIFCIFCAICCTFWGIFQYFFGENFVVLKRFFGPFSVFFVTIFVSPWSNWRPLNWFHATKGIDLKSKSIALSFRLALLFVIINS